MKNPNKVKRPHNQFCYLTKIYKSCRIFTYRPGDSQLTIHAPCSPMNHGTTQFFNALLLVLNKEKRKVLENTTKLKNDESKMHKTLNSDNVNDDLLFFKSTTFFMFVL